MRRHFFEEACMTKSSRLTAIITIGAVLVLGVDYKMAASQTRAPHYANRIVWTGVYTHEQAARGKLAYTQLCSRCHREDLSGGETGPRPGRPARAIQERLPGRPRGVA
jgi:cytochrome c5